MGWFLSIAIVTISFAMRVAVAMESGQLVPHYDLIDRGSSICNALGVGKFNKDSAVVEKSRLAISICIEKEEKARDLLRTREVEPRLMTYCKQKVRVLNSYVRLADCIEKEEKARDSLKKRQVEPRLMNYCKRKVRAGYINLYNCINRESNAARYLTERNIDERIMRHCEQQSYEDGIGLSYWKLQRCVVGMTP